MSSIKKLVSRFSKVGFAVVLLSPAVLQAQLFDFQGEVVGPYAGGTTTITSTGVSARFSADGLQIRDISGFGFPGASSRVLSSSSDASVITMELLGGATATGITFRNWISGIYTSEVDNIVMSAYDASGNLLGSVTSSSEFISLSFAGISKVTWDDVATGYVLDEVQLRGVSTTVPEPSTYALVAVGMALIGGISRRRRTA